MSSPKERLEYADTLRRNVDECNYSCRKAAPAKERYRINDASIIVPEVPTKTHFVQFISSYAETLESQSALLRVIGNLIKQDQYFAEHDQRREEQLNIVQNMFDGFRYSAPLQKNITSLKIPVRDNVNDLQS
ncbi:unnamed protein product [Oikopleura dioica]|uniref:Uncharacterized protein n=1 Tax=Oikopleura dioica TaxID=34765 RepID=E4YUN3_OIKDI|nr:unnamed protein product [Oikopleura dioica]